MSHVIEKPRATKAKSLRTAPIKSATPANAMEEIDMLVQPIAERINPLSILFASWPWGGDFPGRNELIEVDNLLTDLSRPLHEWQEKGEPPRPLTGPMLDAAKDYLKAALIEIEAAVDFNPGQRFLLKLLAREALKQVETLGGAFVEACLGRLAGLKAMAVDTTGQPLTASTPFEITERTKLTDAGSAAADLVTRCAYDIEVLANQVTLLGDRCDGETDTNLGAILRCYGTTIAELNSQIISFTSGDELTMGEVHRSIYRDAKFYVGPDHV